MEKLTKLILEKFKKMKDDPCWKGYKMVGMKKGKGGKPVPNCVPESVQENKDAAYMQKAKSEAALKKGNLTKDEEKFHKAKIENISKFISKQVKEGFISAAPKPSSSPLSNQQPNTNLVKPKKQKTPVTKPMTPKTF